MGDFKADRYFEIEDWEADSSDNPQPATFRLQVTDIYVPSGVEGYDIGAILSDLITASGFNLSIREVAAPNIKQRAVTNSITAPTAGSVIQCGHVEGA